MPTLIITVVTLAYPFLVFLLIDRVPPAVFAMLLLAVWFARHRLQNSVHGELLPARWLLIGAGFLLVMFVLNEKKWVMLYPVVVSSAFFAVFAWSLRNPPTVIERLARLQEPDLPAEGVAYTRKVTWVWCIFFVTNSLIAGGTVWWSDLPLWTLYNGCISYIAMGLIFAVEWLVRINVRNAYSG